MVAGRGSWVVGVVLAGLTGCAAGAVQVPLRAEPGPAPELTLVWVGRGECERLVDGRWVRAPEFDYEFSVEQRRSRDAWASVKSLRRHHPAYDGSAGPRAQTLFFDVALGPVDARGRVTSTVRSTLGDGHGDSDAEFRAAALTLGARVGPGAPFDRYRITQTYDYEAGELREQVELNQGDAPWVRNTEVATLFAATRFPSPPTRRREGL